MYKLLCAHNDCVDRYCHMKGPGIVLYQNSEILSTNILNLIRLIICELRVAKYFSWVPTLTDYCALSIILEVR